MRTISTVRNKFILFWTKSSTTHPPFGKLRFIIRCPKRPTLNPNLNKTPHSTSITLQPTPFLFRHTSFRLSQPQECTHLSHLSFTIPHLFDHTKINCIFQGNPNYAYGYQVNDGNTGDFHSRQESRQGGNVVGRYSLLEPTGNVRIVNYVANSNGFQAQVQNTAG